MPLHPKTPSSLASFKSRTVLSFWYRITQVVMEKEAVKWLSSSSSSKSTEKKLPLWSRMYAHTDGWTGWRRNASGGQKEGRSRHKKSVSQDRTGVADWVMPLNPTDNARIPSLSRSHWNPSVSPSSPCTIPSHLQACAAWRTRTEKQHSMPIYQHCYSSTNHYHCSGKSGHYTTTILRLRIGAWFTRYRNCKFHNGCRTISRHADGISRYSVPPSAGPLLPLYHCYFHLTAVFPGELALDSSHSNPPSPSVLEKNLRD